MNDEFYMRKALEIAKLGEGKVNPNPLVGAVIVKNSKIISEGWHKNFGDSHAEINAIKNAKEDIKGATLYVNLEPCSHFGKTPPCVKKLVESGIKRCVISTLDPNPLVSGRGVEILKENGIEVKIGVLKDEALKLNRVFFKYIKERVPYIFLKVGITLDGKIATRYGKSKWITNGKAREKVQQLRNKYMAIMVGINTILEDNPSLNSRMENSRNPFRIIIDPELKIDIKSKVLSFNDGKTIIVTSEENLNSMKISELKRLNTKILFHSSKNFKLKSVIEEIGKLGIDSIILEGGGKLISNAFSEKIIDGGEIFIAPKIIGDSKAISFIEGFNFPEIEDIFNLPNPSFNIYDDNVSIEFYR